MFFYSYKYRLQPTKEQEVLLNKHFGCTRYIYNYYLNKSIETYKNEKKSLSCHNNINELPELKKELLWLKEVNAQSLQQSLKHLEVAYKNFFRNIKNKKPGKKGFPQFKCKNEKQSFTVFQDTKIIDNKLFIPKFKTGIKFIKDSRVFEGGIKHATISRNKAGQYFASILVEKEIQNLPKNMNVVGIDINVKRMVCSNNKNFNNPLPSTTKYKKKLKILAKSVSRKKVGSNSRKKAQLKLNKLYNKTVNIRENHLHQISRQIINENQVICIEDLDVKSMLKKIGIEEEPRWLQRKKHRAIADASFFSFITKLIYKAKWYGREIIKINKYFPSSKKCSCCGKINHELEQEKDWFCFNCWSMHDRDENAAANILSEGLRCLAKRAAGTAE